ncbi:hypothetical protein Ancab_034722 [Ancistrocladus abbreviatus]
MVTFESLKRKNQQLSVIVTAAVALSPPHSSLPTFISAPVTIDSSVAGEEFRAQSHGDDMGQSPRRKFLLISP